MTKRVMKSLAAVCCVVAIGASGQVSPQAPYKILDHWKVGGTGGWDYLLADSEAHRLYLTHNVSVDVVDTTTGKLVGSVTGLKGTHGVVLDPDGKVGYISDGTANAVVVFDRKTLAVSASIPAGTNPDGMTYEPKTKTVWAFNGRSNNASVIDTKTRMVIATIALPGKPEFPQADGAGSVFVNIEDKNEIVKMDAASHTVTATWPIAGCDSPSGLSYDAAHKRLFSVCGGGKMAVTNAVTGEQLALASIGEGPDAARYDAKSQLAFASNGRSGTLSVVDAAHGYTTIETLPTKMGARTMEYDAKADRLYLVTAEFGPPPEGSQRAPALPDTFEVIVVGR